MTKLGAVLVAVVYLVAAADFTSTLDSAPAQPPERCGGVHVASPAFERCHRQFAADMDTWRLRLDELRVGFKGREHVYSAVSTLALLIAVIAAYPGRPAERRRFFAGVASIGAFLVVVTGALVFLTLGTVVNTAAGDPGSANDVSAFAPALTMLGIGAVGGALFRLSRAADDRKPAVSERTAQTPGDAEPWHQTASRDGATLRKPPAAPLAVAGLAFLTITIWSSSQPECYEPKPGWLNTMGDLAQLAVVASVVLGLFTLLGRRWITGLLCAAGIPVLYLFAALVVGLRC
jgi:hypothetical protein